MSDPIESERVKSPTTQSSATAEAGASHAETRRLRERGVCQQGEQSDEQRDSHKFLGKDFRNQLRHQALVFVVQRVGRASRKRFDLQS